MTACLQEMDMKMKEKQRSFHKTACPRGLFKWQKTTKCPHDSVSTRNMKMKEKQRSVHKIACPRGILKWQKNK